MKLATSDLTHPTISLPPSLLVDEIITDNSTSEVLDRHVPPHTTTTSSPEPQETLSDAAVPHTTSPKCLKPPSSADDHDQDVSFINGRFSFGNVCAYMPTLNSPNASQQGSEGDWVEGSEEEGEEFLGEAYHHNIVNKGDNDDSGGSDDIGQQNSQGGNDKYHEEGEDGDIEVKSVIESCKESLSRVVVASECADQLQQQHCDSLDSNGSKSPEVEDWETNDDDDDTVDEELSEILEIKEGDGREHANEEGSDADKGGQLEGTNESSLHNGSATQGQNQIHSANNFQKQGDLQGVQVHDQPQGGEEQTERHLMKEGTTRAEEEHCTVLAGSPIQEKLDQTKQDQQCQIQQIKSESETLDKNCQTGLMEEQIMEVFDRNIPIDGNIESTDDDIVSFTPSADKTTEVTNCDTHNEEDETKSTELPKISQKVETNEQHVADPLASSTSRCLVPELSLDLLNNNGGTIDEPAPLMADRSRSNAAVRTQSHTQAGRDRNNESSLKANHTRSQSWCRGQRFPKVVSWSGSGETCGGREATGAKNVNNSGRNELFEGTLIEGNSSMVLPRHHPTHTRCLPLGIKSSIGCLPPKSATSFESKSHFVERSSTSNTHKRRPGVFLSDKAYSSSQLGPLLYPGQVRYHSLSRSPSVPLHYNTSNEIWMGRSNECSRCSSTQEAIHEKSIFSPHKIVEPIGDNVFSVSGDSSYEHRSQRQHSSPSLQPLLHDPPPTSQSLVRHQSPRLSAIPHHTSSPSLSVICHHSPTTLPSIQHPAPNIHPFDSPLSIAQSITSTKNSSYCRIYNDGKTGDPTYQVKHQGVVLQKLIHASRIPIYIAPAVISGLDSSRPVCGNSSYFPCFSSHPSASGCQKFSSQYIPYVNRPVSYANLELGKFHGDAQPTPRQKKNKVEGSSKGLVAEVDEGADQSSSPLIVPMNYRHTSFGWSDAVGGCYPVYPYHEVGRKSTGDESEEELINERHEVESPHKLVIDVVKELKLNPSEKDFIAASCKGVEDCQGLQRVGVMDVGEKGIYDCHNSKERISIRGSVSHDTSVFCFTTDTNQKSVSSCCSDDSPSPSFHSPTFNAESDDQDVIDVLDLPQTTAKLPAPKTSSWNGFISNISQSLHSSFSPSWYKSISGPSKQGGLNQLSSVEIPPSKHQPLISLSSTPNPSAALRSTAAKNDSKRHHHLLQFVTDQISSSLEVRLLSDGKHCTQDVDVNIESTANKSRHVKPPICPLPTTTAATTTLSPVFHRTITDESNIRRASGPSPLSDNNLQQEHHLKSFMKATTSSRGAGLTSDNIPCKCQSFYQGVIGTRGYSNADCRSQEGSVQMQRSVSHPTIKVYEKEKREDVLVNQGSIERNERRNASFDPLYIYPSFNSSYTSPSLKSSVQSTHPSVAMSDGCSSLDNKATVDLLKQQTSSNVASDGIPSFRLPIGRSSSSHARITHLRDSTVGGVKPAAKQDNNQKLRRRSPIVCKAVPYTPLFANKIGGGRRGSVKNPQPKPKAGFRDQSKKSNVIYTKGTLMEPKREKLNTDESQNLEEGKKLGSVEVIAQELKMLNEVCENSSTTLKVTTVMTTATDSEK